MSKIYYKSVPFSKEDITLALESGVDGLIVPRETVDSTASLARVEVYSDIEMPSVAMNEKKDEEEICVRLIAGERVVLAKGWEIIPVENLLAQTRSVHVEVSDLAEAKLASGILECGVESLVVLPDALMSLKSIVEECRQSQGKEELQIAEIVEVSTVGLGHRVCVDTLSVFKKGQGMLVGNSSAFTFLVHAETESNEYVAARPFRVNAGGVHAYAVLPNDRTCYLEELRAGDEVLAVNADGTTSLAIVGRVKVEVRPMLKVVAKMNDTLGTIFLQNAETIRLTLASGEPISVVQLKEGDKILCREDQAGRHFGMRITEDIKEL